MTIKSPIIRINVQQADFDVNSEVTLLTTDNKNIGAIVNFIGLCRDEAGILKALELEHYPHMAEKQLEKLAHKAASQWDLDAITIIHRYGIIEVSQNIVLVITASRHRNAAFQSANFIMDYLKTDAPFWKKEHLKDGTIGHWVEAKHEDQLKRDNW